MHSSVLCQGYTHITSNNRAANAIPSGAPPQLRRNAIPSGDPLSGASNVTLKRRYRLYHFATTPYSCARRLLYELRLLKKGDSKRRKRTGKGRKNGATTYIRAVKDSPHLGQ